MKTDAADVAYAFLRAVSPFVATSSSTGSHVCADADRNVGTARREECATSAYAPMFVVNLGLCFAAEGVEGADGPAQWAGATTAPIARSARNPW